MAKLISATFAFFLLTAISVRSHAQPYVDCNLETVQSFCDRIKATEKTQLKSKSPYTFSNGMQMPPIDSITGNTMPLMEDGRTPRYNYASLKKITDLYPEVQKYARESILQGRKVEELSDEEKNLLSRIQTMRLSNFSSSVDQETCQSNHRFGYNAATHTLVVCPEMAGYPKSAIVWSMAAFMGRGLGSCVANNLKYLNAKKEIVFDTFKDDKHPFNQSCKSSGCTPDSDGRSLMGCMKAGGYPDGDKPLDFSKPELKTIRDNKIRYALQTKSPDLPVPSETAAEALSNPKNIAWAQSKVTEIKECYPEFTNSRVDAGVQDWFGSEVAARYLEDHPLSAQTPEDNLQPIAAMADFVCRTPASEELTRRFHVPVKTRFESAIFANARLRKAMNCNPAVPAKRTCEVSIKPYLPVRQDPHPSNSQQRNTNR